MTDVVVKKQYVCVGSHKYIVIILVINVVVVFVVVMLVCHSSRKHIKYFHSRNIYPFKKNFAFLLCKKSLMKSPLQSKIYTTIYSVRVVYLNEEVK